MCHPARSDLGNGEYSIQFNEPLPGRVNMKFHIIKNGMPDSFLISTNRTNNVKFNKPGQNSNSLNY
jgi:hypothetical protein